MFERLREQAKLRKSPWNILQVMFLFAGMVGASFLMIKTAWALQNRLFPADTIFSGGTELGEILMIIPIMFLSVPFGAMLTDFIILSIPSAKKDFEEELNGSKQGWLKMSMIYYLKMIVVFMLILVPISMVGFYSYIYVTPAGITLRPVFSIKERHYGWDDIVRIYAGCSISENGFVWNYVMYMKDGENIDFFKINILKFVNVFDKIKPFIRSQRDIVYDYSLGDKEIMELRRKLPKSAEQYIKIIKNED